MTVRAKMKVNCVKKYYKGSESIELSCVYTGSKEDNQFARATPQGNAMLVIENENLFGFFQPGDEFYIDFIKVGEKND